MQARQNVLNQIRTEEELEIGVEALLQLEPRFERAFQLTGMPPLRLRNDGFSELLRAIVSQQLSVAAAAGIWGRLEEAGLSEPGAILAARDEMLRAAGLSRQKIRYAKALAEAEIDYDALHGLPDEDVMACLTMIPGIGKWTAEIYLMFSLGRPDIFAPDDLALQVAASSLFSLKERPRPGAFRAMAEAWAPWRSVAARMLWAYYRVEKGREGV